MSNEVISILVLVAIFLVATVLPVHMGILGLVATFVVGTFVVDLDADAVFAGFPGDLFVILVGVTYLFAIAKANGTVDWLVQASVRAVGGRIALIPWVMFFVTGVMTALGAVVPASVAIVAPIGLGFARRYNINPVLMGLLIINGAAAGGFSPLSVFGAIVNGVVDRNDLASNELLLGGMSILFNFVLSVIVFVLFGGRELLGRASGDEPASSGRRAGRRSPRGRGAQGAPTTTTSSATTTSTATAGSRSSASSAWSSGRSGSTSTSASWR